MFACLAREARLSDRLPLAFRVTLLRAYVLSVGLYACDALPVPAWYVNGLDSIVYMIIFAGRLRSLVAPHVMPCFVNVVCNRLPSS